MLTLPVSEGLDRLVTLRDQLLHSGKFQATQAGVSLGKLAEPGAYACEPAAQTALALLNIQAANDALRAGLAVDFDGNINELRLRIRQTLSCAPHLSYFWLLSFWTTTLDVGLSAEAIRMLEMSYDTAPSEAWIAVRRASIAVNIIPLAPPRLREQILAEFRFMVRDGLLREAAATYAVARDPVKELLKAELTEAPDLHRAEFWAAVSDRKPPPMADPAAPSL